MQVIAVGYQKSFRDASIKLFKKDGELINIYLMQFSKFKKFNRNYEFNIKSLSIMICFGVKFTKLFAKRIIYN